MARFAGVCRRVYKSAIPIALWLLTFVESFGTVLLERGLYFYAHDVLRFSQPTNLLLALLHGVAYAIGAFASHRLARVWAERRLLACVLLVLLALHVLTACLGEPTLIMAIYALIGLAHGVKWPLIESFVGAGHTRESTLVVLGYFNVTWAIAVPLAVAVSGPLVASAAPTLLFWLAALLNVVAWVTCLALPARPRHAAPAVSGPGDAGMIARDRALLHSARWSMLGGYAFLFLLAPLMPGVFQRLELRVEHATLVACLLDALRALSFALLARFKAWRGRRWPLALCIAGLPSGFLLAAFGNQLGLVVVGEVLFGIASGLSYYAALYYALVLGSASVEAGGTHEALIGVAFALGPLSGLAGHGLSHSGLTVNAGLLLAVLPLFVICAIGAARPLRSVSG